MKHLLAIVTGLLVPLATLHAAELKVAPVFSDHLVLQRDMPVPVWGSANPGDAVTVEFAGQSKKTTADAQGHWMLKLDALPASAEARELTVRSKAVVTISDVLVGEVWLGSGQSNMAGSISIFKGNDDGLEKLLAGAPYPQIRLLKQGGIWKAATVGSIDAFSAILFAYGARLQTELKVPIGLVSAAVGGTPSGYWLSEEMYRNDDACKAQVEKFAETYDFDAAMKAYERNLATWKENAEKAKQTGARVGRQPPIPQQPGESAGQIGHLYAAHVQPFVPYAIRGVLWDQGEGGTGITGVDQFHLMGALIKGWRKAWGQDFPFLYVQKPSGGGTAWDLANPTTKNASRLTPQPAEVPRNIDGLPREVHLKIQQHPNTAMVTSTDLGGMTHPINKSGYADRALFVAKGFVYGAKVEYSGPLYASHEIADGRVRIRFTHIGQGLTASTGSGPSAPGHSDKVQGFIIAGADKQFVWADAVIDGDAVVVSSPSVPQPAAVRYAWSSNSPWANLFNKDGLPAQTFRTDDWGGVPGR
jgi:sialate O-acetylesterase